MFAALRHVPALLVKARPAHLTFFVTRSCNARCPFCFYAGERDDAGGPPELSLDEIRRVARSTGPLLWVLFSGGEPFLRRDLAAIAQVFHDESRAAFLTFPTNGLLPERIASATEEVLERCPRSVVVVKLSLDGVGRDHDEIRGTPGGFDQLLRTYARLAALAARHRRLELGVNTLFCSRNEGSMDRIAEFVLGLEGIRSHTLTLIRADQSPPGWRDVDLAAYRRATARIESAWGARRPRRHRFAGSALKAAQDRVQHQLVHDTLLLGRAILPCHAGRRSLVLSERGELAACEARRRETLGNVRDAGLDVGAVLRSPRALRVLDDVRGGGCHCAHECNLLVNMMFEARAYPRLLREWARLRLGLEPTPRGERSAA